MEEQRKRRTLLRVCAVVSAVVVGYVSLPGLLFDLDSEDDYMGMVSSIAVPFLGGVLLGAVFGRVLKPLLLGLLTGVDGLVMVAPVVIVSPQLTWWIPGVFAFLALVAVAGAYLGNWLFTRRARPAGDWRG